MSAREKVREALEFYAEADNYGAQDDSGDFWSEADEDAGARAREALKRWGFPASPLRSTMPPPMGKEYVELLLECEGVLKAYADKGLPLVGKPTVDLAHLRGLAIRCGLAAARLGGALEED